jgi:hypothetical protein
MSSRRSNTLPTSTLAPVLKTRYVAEQLHRMGEVGAMDVAAWLEATGRFSVSHNAYQLDPETREPLDHCRVELNDGTFETFDLAGMRLDEKGAPGHRLYVECKNYSADGNQGTLYKEYLAICYSAFVRRWTAVHAPPSLEFMWATTHPFLVGTFLELRGKEKIKAACEDEDLKERLGDVEYDDDVAEALSQRLWLCVVNDRLKDMLMGVELLIALKGQMIRLRQP